MKLQMLMKLLQVKSKTNSADMSSVLNDLLKVKSYMSFSEKDKLIRSVIKESFEERLDGSLRSFSTLRSKKFTEKLLEAYTDIEIDDSTYDTLAENGLLTAILSLIGNEYELCSRMLASYIEDILNGFVKLEDLQ